MSVHMVESHETVDGQATAEPRPAGRGQVAARRALAGLRDNGIVVSCLLLFVGLSLANDAFLTQTNILNVLDQQASLGIVACGITLAMIAGEFDLSVGAVFAIAGVLAAKVGAAGHPVLGLLTALGVGVGFGIANGLLVTL